MDLRGTGAGLALARGCYNAGRSEDVRAALAEVHRWSPDSPLLLLGVSLGGNISLKLAGELPVFPVPGLRRVAALGPPIDLEHCSRLLARPSNRLYEHSFLNLLVAEARQRQRLFPDLPPLRLPRRLTMRLFDDLYTAPRCGFADALDYYGRASALPLVGRIPLPTLILTARDDPFIAVEPFEGLRAPENVAVHIAPHGGHLGFVGWDGAGGIRWGERRVLDWLLQPFAAASN
jgi:predicted alpha/beta-fold hydrolase